MREATTNITLESVRERLLNNILWVLVFFGGIATAIAAITQIKEEQYLIATLYAACYILIFGIASNPSLGYTIRAFTCLFVSYAVALSEFYFYGISELSYAFMYTLVIFSGLLFGIRMGLGSLALVILSISTRYWTGMYTKSLQRGEALDVTGHLLSWLSSILTFSFLILLTLVVLTLMLRLLGRSLRDSNRLVEELKHEIDKHKKTQRELAESKEHYRLLTENAHDIIWTTDLNGDMTYISPAVEHMRGYTPEEAMAGGLALSGPPENAEIFAKALQEELALEASGKADPDRSRTFKLKLFHRNGSTIDTEIVTVILHNDDSEPIGVLGVTRDITDRKQLEEQLYQAQKMEAVGHLAGGVAHDFNNLLQVIQGYGEMALEESKGRTSHDDLKQVLGAADRATTLVRQLLAFSRKQILTLEDMDLSIVVSDLAKMIRRVIGAHIAFNIHSEPGLKSIHADKGQFEQILMNLCVNARDAMPNGGTLTIETSNAKLDDSFCNINTWARPGHYVVLSVADTGIGMDEETRRHIFDPFFTTKEVGKGTGLGLSTVFGIVRQHDGLIHASSEAGVGTTFRIYLPMLTREMSTAQEEEIAPPQGGAETILLADDDEGVRSVAKAILHSAGYTVLTAVDGENAIRVFDENADEIDLALLDVVMPKLGGRAVYDHIREARPKTSILFASGYSTGGIHTDFILDEGMRLLLKPYQRDTILREVRDALDA